MYLTVVKYPEISQFRACLKNRFQTNQGVKTRENRLPTPKKRWVCGIHFEYF